MKAIRFLSNYLNLIIDAFHPTGMKRKPAMIENTVGIPFEHFNKLNDRFCFLVFLSSHMIENPPKRFNQVKLVKDNRGLWEKFVHDRNESF